MKLVVTLAGLALIGCTSTAVLDIGQGRYSVTRSSQWSSAHAREDALEDAQNYCAERKQKAAVDSFTEGLEGNPFAGITSHLIFHCE